MKFGQRPCNIVQGLWPDFGVTLKICKKNPILIGISLNFLHNIRTCICIRKIIKMEKSLLAIFDKKTSIGFLSNFWNNFNEFIKKNY